MQPTTGKLAAIYCRVSTEAQATDEKNSLAAQEAACRTRAAEDGLVVAENYVVLDAFSASEDVEHRAKLESLLRAAEDFAFDYVLMDVVDRTTRGGVLEFAEICKRFLRWNVTPLWARDREIDLTTQDGQMMAAMKAWAAAQEKESIARRFADGKRGRVARGLLGRWSAPAYGYRWDNPTKGAADAKQAWVLDPATAPTAQRIFRLLTKEGLSTIEVANLLNAEGEPPPSVYKGQRRKAPRWQGQPPRWTSGTINYLVKNSAYMGQRVQYRYKSEARDPRERKAEGLKTRAKIIRQDLATCPTVAVPALVDVDTWNAAQAALDHNRRGKHRQPVAYRADEVLLYGGAVRCGVCHNACTARARANGWVYMCSRHKRLTDGAQCPGMRRGARTVDSFVWREIVKLIRDPDYLRSLLHRTDEAWSPATQVAHYEQLIAEKTAELDGITDEVTHCAGNPALAGLRAALHQRYQAVDEERARYADKLAQAQDEQNRRAESDERLRRAAALAASHASALTDLTADERRAIALDLNTVVWLFAEDSGQPAMQLVVDLSTDASAQRRDPEWMASRWTEQGHSLSVLVLDPSVTDPTWRSGLTEGPQLGGHIVVDFSNVPEESYDNDDDDDDDPDPATPRQLDAPPAPAVDSGIPPLGHAPTAAPRYNPVSSTLTTASTSTGCTKRPGRPPPMAR